MSTENYKGYELNKPKFAESEMGHRELGNFKKLIDKDENLQEQIIAESRTRIADFHLLGSRIVAETGERIAANHNLQSQITEVDGKLTSTTLSHQNHVNDKNNPHEVTKEQVGLGNVDNTSDINKPISTAQQDALNNLQTQVNAKWDESGGKNWVENLVNALETGIFKFRGILSQEPPTNTPENTQFSDGTLWIEKGVQGDMPNLAAGVFWRCYELRNNAWSLTANRTYGIPGGSDNPDVSERIWDVWANRNDGKAYYRFDFRWEHLNFTLDLSDYYTRAQVDGELGKKANTNHTHTIANVTSLQSSLDAKQNTLSRTVGGNDNATGTVTDTGGNLSVPIPATVVAPAASATQITAGTRTLRATLKILIDNIAHLFANKANTNHTHSNLVEKSTEVSPDNGLDFNDFIATGIYKLGGSSVNPPISDLDTLGTPLPGHPIGWNLFVFSNFSSVVGVQGICQFAHAYNRFHQEEFRFVYFRTFQHGAWSSWRAIAENRDLENHTHTIANVTNLQSSLDAKQNTLSRTVGGNDNATGTVTDTGGNLSVPIPATVVAPAASATQITAGTRTLRATLKILIDNIAHLFANKQNNLVAGANVQISGNTISATDTIYAHPSHTARNTALTGANVYSNVEVNNQGHVTNLTSRALTAANISAAPANISLEAATTASIDTTTNAVPSATVANVMQTIWNKIRMVVNVLNTKADTGHTHSTFNRTSSVLSGANVFSNVVVSNGIVTNIATRALAAADVGAPAAITVFYEGLGENEIMRLSTRSHSAFGDQFIIFDSNNNSMAVVKNTSNVGNTVLIDGDVEFGHVSNCISIRRKAGRGFPNSRVTVFVFGGYHGIASWRADLVPMKVTGTFTPIIAAADRPVKMTWAGIRPGAPDWQAVINLRPNTRYGASYSVRSVGVTYTYNTPVVVNFTTLQPGSADQTLIANSLRVVTTTGASMTQGGGPSVLQLRALIPHTTTFPGNGEAYIQVWEIA